MPQSGAISFGRLGRAAGMHTPRRDTAVPSRQPIGYRVPYHRGARPGENDQPRDRTRREIFAGGPRHLGIPEPRDLGETLERGLILKSRETGAPYFTDRLVESVRTAAGVCRQMLLNLGRHFEVPRARWGALARRIEALPGGQLDLPVAGLNPCWEALAEQYAARIRSRRGEAAEGRGTAGEAGADYQRVDLARLEVMRPRGVGAEHIALAAAERLGLTAKLTALGLNGHQVPAALGLIVGRLVYPASERATHPWLTRRGGLGELLDYDFSTLDLNRLVRVSDQLLAHRQALEEPLYQQERDLFSLPESITRYDLTNTFFEGTARANPKAQRGHANSILSRPS